MAINFTQEIELILQEFASRCGLRGMKGRKRRAVLERGDDGEETQLYPLSPFPLQGKGVELLCFGGHPKKSDISCEEVVQ